MEFISPGMSNDEINRINRHCYDNQADRWQRFPFKDVLPQWVLAYHDALSLGNRVLEIGSGTGAFANWFNENGFAVLCLDPSAEMVRRCQKKGLPTLQMTFQEYNGTERFAMISAILSLLHIPKNEFAIQIAKIASFLSPNGTFILGMIEGSTEGLIEEETGYPRFFSTYSKQEILEATNPYFSLLDCHTTYGSEGVTYLAFIFCLNKILS